jgi:hypothetical protein
MTREEAIFCEGTYLGENNCVNCKYYATDTCESRESHKMAIEALKLIPDNATNGDVIKALFPNYRTDEMSHSVWVGYDDMSFRREWWDAPYKRGEKK